MVVEDNPQVIIGVDMVGVQLNLPSHAILNIEVRLVVELCHPVVTYLVLFVLTYGCTHVLLVLKLLCVDSLLLLPGKI